MSAPDPVATPTLAVTPRPPIPQASGGILLQTLRLVRFDLFQAWRRVMAKVLLGILVGLFALVVLFVLLAYTSTSAVSVAPGGQPDQQQTLNAAAELLRDELTFPGTLGLTLGYTGFIGVILLCILAGALVGGEYGSGTIRLSLSRGVARGQALAAKIGALAVLAVVVVGLMLLLGTLVGFTLGPALGGTPAGVPAGGWTQLLASWGATSLRLFAYGLIALFLATVGRSAAAGIGGSIGFLVVEVVLQPILLAVASFLSGTASTLVQIVVNALLRTNADIVTSAAQQGPLQLTPTPSGAAGAVATASAIAQPTPSQALLTMLLWCAVLVAGSYLLLRGRDVTE
jgi:ABC-type transport system involved in multi-copper enzyme maturation permease subunit